VSITADQVLARCEAMVPELIDRADQGERERRLPAATFQDVTDNDLWRLLDLWRLVVPISLGGHGLGIEPLAYDTRILAHGCPASLWAISFLVSAGGCSPRSRPRRGPSCSCGSACRRSRWHHCPRRGTLEAVDGGFVVTGRWEWATGLPNADWVKVHAVQLALERANW
jgi:alkylation response protein AidB-like acyl-CoA dehydrogenase